MSPAATKPSLLLACYFPRSVALEGVGTFVTGLAEGMAAAGWAVRLLLPAGRCRPVEGVQRLTYRPGAAGLVRYRRALRSASGETDAVLVVENNPNMAFVARWSRRPGSTFCYFYTPLQSLRALREMGATGQALKHAAAKSRLWSRWRRWDDLRCIVATDFQARQLRPFGPAEVHTVCGCGISRGREFPPRPQARAALGWSPDEPMIGYLGHFSPAKGVEVLLAAFADGLNRHTLALAHSGKGRLRGRGPALLELLRRQGRLREFGVVDVPAFLSACDAVVLPYVTSSNHHPPLVMMESFAAGTAVVTTDVGGLSEVHRPGLTGEIVPPRDADALGRAVVRLVDGERGGGNPMGRNARRAFEDRWCREVFCAELARILGESLR